MVADKELVAMLAPAAMGARKNLREVTHERGHLAVRICCMHSWSVFSAVTLKAQRAFLRTFLASKSPKQFDTDYLTASDMARKHDHNFAPTSVGIRGRNLSGMG